MPIKFLVKPINGSVLVFMEILACSCPKNHAAQSPNHSHMTVRHSGRPPAMGPTVETPDLLPCPAERGVGGGGQPTSGAHTCGVRQHLLPQIQHLSAVCLPVGHRSLEPEVPPSHLTNVETEASMGHTVRLERWT